MPEIEAPQAVCEVVMAAPPNSMTLSVITSTASKRPDPAAIEAALFRPQTGYYDDIIAEAAAWLESLAINHPFVDGNKRIAFAAADVFLRINGWCLKRSSIVIHKEMLQLFEAGTFDIAHLEPWLREFAIIQE